MAAIRPSRAMMKSVPAFAGASPGRPDTHGTRYLAPTESTVRQLPNNSLLLRPLKGWQGYAEANANWKLDPTGHLAINVSYKNGAAPPKFNRVNTVQAGLLLKF